jgi:beta-N-acetylhexosaminidase
MLVIGFDGCEINEHSPVAQWIAKDGLGGVLLFDKNLSTGTFGKNLKNQTQIRQLTNQLNQYALESSEHNKDIPLFIALDYEGGAVDRLKHVEGCMSTKNASQLAQLSEEAFEQELNQMAETLKSLGFNLNFAPVVDLNLNSKQGIIGALGRSFSARPELVAQVAKQFVDQFSQHGIACAYKHFPGHGSAVGDTHEGFVDVTDTFQAAELLPYHLLLKDNSNPVMVMTAHVINKILDESGLPATLSRDILTGLLRETIGFDGVIISDDLQMQAISNHYTLDDSLSLTINAGADMIIFGNQLGSIAATEVIDRIEALVLNHKIDINRIEEAYNRVVRLKKQLNCVEYAL